MVRILDLRQLQCFVAVAEEASFSKAAERLNMTQPPLSRQIRRLEEHLGAELFLRTTRSVRLSTAGRALLPEAHRILRLVEHVSLQAARVPGSATGTIRLGFTAASAYSFLPQLVGASRRRFPQLDLQLRDIPSPAQVDALMSGQIDLGFLRSPTSPPDIRMERIVQEPFVLGMPVDCDLARRREVTLRQLQGREFIMYSPLWDSLFHALITALFQNAGVSPNISQFVTQVHSVLALVEAGLGVGLVPQSALSLRFAGVTFRHLVRRERQTVDLFLAWREEQDLPAIGTFAAFVREFARQWSPPDLALAPEERAAAGAA